jgi:acetyl esterase/lipase
MSYPEIKVLPNNPELDGLAMFVPDVVFSTATGVELKMQIMMPWSNMNKDAGIPRRPLIVFLQGSGWTFPNVNYEIPQLAEYARMGYVVATITHRSYLDGYQAPAFLQDTKTAIRFLRKNADQYGIDPSRVCFWGTSSGGNTSMLVALTGDDPKYKTGEYAEYSDSVNVAVECFGPTDLPKLFARLIGNPEIEHALEQMTGGKLSEHMDLLNEMSPILRIEQGKKYPPMLLIHGDADQLVPYEQSESMFKALLDNGCEAEMIRIENAPHEDSFWSRALHTDIADFINRKL